METLIQSAEGGRKREHQVTKPTRWREGATLFRTLEDYAVEGARIGTKFQLWSMCVQALASWGRVPGARENQELRSKEEGSSAPQGECSKVGGCRSQGKQEN